MKKLILIWLIFAGATITLNAQESGFWWWWGDEAVSVPSQPPPGYEFFITIEGDTFLTVSDDTFYVPISYKIEFEQFNKGKENEKDIISNNTLFAVLPERKWTRI